MKDKIHFGGLFFVKKIPTPSFASRSILPDSLFSLSDCLCETIPNTWSLAWTSEKPEEKRKMGSEFGLSESEQMELTEFCTRAFADKRIGWPNVIRDISTAQNLKRWIKSKSDEIKLLMIGLNSSDSENFIQNEKQYKQDSGVSDCLESKEEIVNSGKILGYEILGSEYGSFHSWFCNSIDGDAFKIFGIKPNDKGFLDSYDEAKLICEMINQEEYGTEPVLWIPWKIYEVE